MSAQEFDSKSVLQLDSWLEPFLPAIDHRYQTFKKWRDAIHLHEGGYDAFTKGYHKLGLIPNDAGEVVYREWAPNAIEAYLIGDFSQSPSSKKPSNTQADRCRSMPDDWNRTSHPLKKNEFGVWEITIPPKSPGVCAIPHDSKIKVRWFASVLTILLKLSQRFP